jgi:quercetin dioxygenase-like cupin family protein
MFRSCGKKGNGYNSDNDSCEREEEMHETNVLKMPGLVDYQKDSIVSREIMNKKAGTVTIFAFDEGQGLSEHKAPFDAMVQVIEGAVTVTIAGEKYSLTEGECIIMPAQEPHAVKAEKRLKMLLTMIKSEE